MVPESQSPSPPSPFPFLGSPRSLTPNLDGPTNGKNSIIFSTKSDIASSKSYTDISISEPSSRSRSMKSLRRKLSQAAMSMRRNGVTNNASEEVPPVPVRPTKKESDDVAGPRFGGQSSSAEGQREAGDSIVYSDTSVRLSATGVSMHALMFFAVGISGLGQRHDPRKSIYARDYPTVGARKRVGCFPHSSGDYRGFF